MKVTIVPAQVTTVEDRIAGNLGLSQLLLLAMPIFGGSMLYAVVPPFMATSTLKMILITLFAVFCGLFAIRIKGKIVLLWIVVLLRYRMRPRYYVYDKRSLHGRDIAQDVITEEDIEEALLPMTQRRRLNLSTAEVARLHELMEHPGADVSFNTKKGGLYVSITEIPEEA